MYKNEKIDKLNVEDILPLTPLQEGMLFHYLNQPKSELYFEQMSFKLSGEIDVTMFKKAWEHVIDCNEMLRTVFRWDKLDTPIQVVLKSRNLPFRELDFYDTDESNRNSLLESILLKDREERIDISSEPFRIILCKFSETLYEMIFSSFHILFDGWSNGIIFKELLDAYNKLKNGETLKNVIKTHYKEYIKWNTLQDKNSKKQYWENYLKGFETKTMLPADKKRQGNTVIVKSYTDTLKEDISLAIKKFTKENDITLATFLYCAWGLILTKYNDIYDILFGTTVSGRIPDIKGIGDMVGLFISTPPVRIKSNPQESILELLKKTNEMLKQRNEYENTSLTEIKPFFDLENHENIFDSIVVIENYPLDRIVDESSNTIEIELRSIFEMTNYELTLVISTDNKIDLRFIYDTDIFDQETIVRLSRQFINSTKAMINNPGMQISKLDILDEDDKKLILFDFNDTDANYNIDNTIYQLFEVQVLKSPDNIAVKFDGDYLTYRQLNEKANQMANYLRKNGVVAETVVGVMLERSFDTIISLLGILKAGGVYLPIDINTPEERIKHMLEDSGAKILISSSEAIKDKSFTALQNFYGNENIKIVKTELREHIRDFDGLPIPDRSLIDISKYKGKIGMASVENCISLQTTRGCPYKCLYCHKIWSKNHVRRSADNILNEMEYYYNNGVRNFAIIDDCFNLDLKNSSELFRKIIANKMDIQMFFPNGLRGDILTHDYIDLMVKAGTRGINLSLETASPRLQKLLKKNLDLEKFKDVVDYITSKHSDIILEMATMHGFPTETEEEAIMTLDFIKSIKWLHFPYIHILKIFPNTEMEEFALEYGVSKSDILRSRNRAFHELPETLPFPKSFTRKYQATFMNEYFLSKERLMRVIPVQMEILNETALAQKYNAYLPVEIKSIQDVIDFAEIDNFKIEAEYKEKIVVPDSIFDRPQQPKKKLDGAKRILFLDLSQHFSSHNMLYKVSEQPIGQIYLLTYLKKVFSDSIDGRVYKAGNDFDSFKELKTLVDEYKPDLIGIRTLTYFKEFFHETVSLLRQWGIEVPIITGGPYASSDYDSILKDRNVNIAIIGEGEYTFTEILKEMLKNDFKIPGEDVLSSIKGIAYVSDTFDDAKDKACKVILADRLANCISLEDKGNLQPYSNYDNLAYIIYTSGFTGRPKGVMVEHRQVNNCIFWMQNEFKLNHNAVIVQRTNLTFDPSVWEVFWPLYIGASIRLITTDQGRDAEFLINLMEKDEGLTMMYCPASMISGMTYLLNAKSVKSKFKLPWLLIGAEPISMETVKSFYQYFEGRIVNTYGPSECTINNTYYYIDRDDTRKIVPIGKPISNNKIYILSKDLQIMPYNSPGEICIGGSSVARGYINNPQKTDASFIKNLFGEKVIYKTGDVGKWLDDGNIEILGRVDEQVKIRGHRIELGEIEETILRYDKIKDCTVVVRDNTKLKKDIYVCKKCGITSAYPGTTINDEGICDICQEWDIYEKCASKYFKTLDDLNVLIKEKSINTKGKYDCLLSYSGGRASAYALYRLVDMGYNVLTLTYDNGYFPKSDMESIKKITSKLGVDNVIVKHKNTDDILRESCKMAHTVCRGCFNVSLSLAAEYSCKNNIPVVIGATLSRGQILENKLSMFYKQGISDVGEIEKELVNLQRSARNMDKPIFDLMNIDVIADGTAYDSVKFVDFYRYCDITNVEMLSYLEEKDEYWKSRKDYAIYSTNCPIKQIGDYHHLKEKGYHYYGAATSWEKRLGHITLDNVKRDLMCYVSQKSFENFSKKISYVPEKLKQKMDTRFICAYYVSDDEVSEIDLKDFVLKWLPGYMVPLHFIRIENMPLTSNGKIDKKMLPEPKANIKSESEYVAPENEVEEKLVEIWQKVLGIDRVGVNDNFFDLGGNSILLIQMHTQIENVYPGKISMTDLFAYTTVSKIALKIKKDEESVFDYNKFKLLDMPSEFFIEGSINKSGATYNFNLKADILEKIMYIAENERVEVFDVLASIYIYLLSETTGAKNIPLHTLSEMNTGMALEFDISNITDFSAMFNLVNKQFRNKEAGVVYKLDSIYGMVADISHTSIIPAFFKQSLFNGNISSIRILDIAFEVNEEPDSIQLTCCYNTSRIHKDKIHDFIDNYVELLEAFVDSYMNEESEQLEGV